jgi:hypothetical protein
MTVRLASEYAQVQERALARLHGVDGGHRRACFQPHLRSAFRVLARGPAARITTRKQKGRLAFEFVLYAFDLKPLVELALKLWRQIGGLEPVQYDLAVRQVRSEPDGVAGGKQEARLLGGDLPDPPTVHRGHVAASENAWRASLATAFRALLRAKFPQVVFAELPTLRAFGSKAGRAMVGLASMNGRGRN